MYRTLFSIHYIYLNMPKSSKSVSKLANVLKKSTKNVSGSFMRSKLILYVLLVLSILNVLFYLSKDK